MCGTSNQPPRQALGEADPAFLVDDRGRMEISWWSCREVYKWMFPKIGVPQNGWFIMENPIKMGCGSKIGLPHSLSKVLLWG